MVLQPSMFCWVSLLESCDTASKKTVSPPGFVRFVTPGGAGGMSFIFTLVPLALQFHAHNTEEGPGRQWTHNYDNCVIARKLALENLQSIKGASNKPVHPPLQKETISLLFWLGNKSAGWLRGRYHFYHPVLSARMERNELHYPREEASLLPACSRSASLLKQNCQCYLLRSHPAMPGLPLNTMFCFDDSKVSLGVKRTQTCLLELTPEGKSM